MSALRQECSIEDMKREFCLIVQEELGFADIYAQQVSDAIVRGLRKRRGGDEIYIPVADKNERDAAIRAAFTGSNRGEVCIRFGISKATFYNILNRRCVG